MLRFYKKEQNFKKMIENCKYQLKRQTNFKKIVSNLQSSFKTQIPDFIYCSMIEHYMNENKPNEVLKVLTNSFLDNIILDRPFYEEVFDKLLSMEILNNDLELILSFYSSSFSPSFPLLCLLKDAVVQEKISENTFKKSIEDYVKYYNEKNENKIDFIDVQNAIGSFEKRENEDIKSTNNIHENYSKERNDDNIINLSYLKRIRLIKRKR
jgi:hypothetical protein